MKGEAMPWRRSTVLEERREFVTWAQQREVAFTELCRRFGVRPKTGYKWLHRYQAEGEAGLSDRTRRPHRSPSRTPSGLEELVVATREAHPAWGGRKIGAFLARQGWESLPAPSTITDILRRHHLLGDHRPRRGYLRFEAPFPNHLWQMDFKGDFSTLVGARCFPLTLLDDHSRYNLSLQACPDQRHRTVRQGLIGVFRRYGLPSRLLCDHGPPWGSDPGRPHTALTIWLARLGIEVLHSAPGHPQTQGKEERFHRTLKAEVLSRRPVWSDLSQVQEAFDLWRPFYNHQRPHESLGQAVPAERYSPSPRPYPEVLSPIEYGSADLVRRVSTAATISFRGRVLKVGRPFVGQPVALRPTQTEGVWGLYFCTLHIKTIDLRDPQ